MTTAALIDELRALGVTLQARHDRLRFHPRSVVTPDLLVRLNAHKPELLLILTQPQNAPVPAAVPSGGELARGDSQQHPVGNEGDGPQDSPAAHSTGALGEQAPGTAPPAHQWKLPPWPPVVPTEILADPRPICRDCRTAPVVPGQPGRPDGLCRSCWFSRQKSRGRCGPTACSTTNAGRPG
jgi:hypothetical protein